jgi:hypothetical protein
MLPGVRRQDARLWWQDWRWYERNPLPWNRVRIHGEFARRRAFVRWPVHGNVLEAFAEGCLEVPSTRCSSRTSGMKRLTESRVAESGPDSG